MGSAWWARAGGISWRVQGSRDGRCLRRSGYLRRAMPETITATRIIDLDLWEGRLPREVENYRNAKPFPHTVLDGFLDTAAAEQAQQAFPRVQDQGWIHYVHVNEKKHGLNKMDRLPPYLREVIQKLNSDRFV